MSLYAGGDGADVKDSQQQCLVKIVKALTTPGSASGGVLRSPSGANAFAPSAVIKASAGTLYSVSVYNTNAATRYLMIFDAAAVPGLATVPLAVVSALTKTTAYYDFGTLGISMFTGIVAALSSTDTSLTITGTNDGLFIAVYA